LGIYGLFGYRKNSIAGCKLNEPDEFLEGFSQRLIIPIQLTEGVTVCDVAIKVRIINSMTARAEEGVYGRIQIFRLKETRMPIIPIGPLRIT
jgi:hypothetical protein